MSASFQIAVDNTLVNEGGLTNDPNDPGGLTNFGISLAAYPGLGADGIRNLSREGAITIYKRDFWDPLHLDSLPSQRLANHVFDEAVNAGLAAAVMQVQALAGIATDGQMGPQTLAAMQLLSPDAFVASRTGYYVGLALHGQHRYLRTWLNRLPVCNRNT